MRTYEEITADIKAAKDRLQELETERVAVMSSKVGIAVGDRVKDERGIIYEVAVLGPWSDKSLTVMGRKITKGGAPSKNVIWLGWTSKLTRAENNF
jgi:hypothetical protein